MFTNGLAADDIKFPCHYEAWYAMGLAKIASISRSLHQDLALKLSVSHNLHQDLAVQWEILTPLARGIIGFIGPKGVLMLPKGL